MFGYVTVNRPEMKVRELELYRSYYCGLCHALHSRYGRRAQMVLSYDGTFLAILLSGVYEPQESERRARCILHPAIVHREISSRYTEYAADMNVMLAFYKAVDDWRDERKHSAKLTAMLLHRDACRISCRYPRQAETLERSLRALRRMEKETLAGEKAPCRMQTSSGSRGTSSGDLSRKDELDAVLARIDQAAGYTGTFLGEMCAVHQDHWAEDLRKTGFYLGKFIYLIDAYDDLKEDQKNGSFNVLLELLRLQEENFDLILREILLDTAALCCRSFERLPILRSVAVLRNILYSGIWVRFHQIRSGEDDQKKRPACEAGTSHI